MSCSALGFLSLPRGELAKAVHRGLFFQGAVLAGGCSSRGLCFQGAALPGIQEKAIACQTHFWPRPCREKMMPELRLRVLFAADSKEIPVLLPAPKLSRVPPPHPLMAAAMYQWEWWWYTWWCWDEEQNCWQEWGRWQAGLSSRALYSLLCQAPAAPPAAPMTVGALALALSLFVFPC
jgi:hypothetical protein